MPSIDFEGGPPAPRALRTRRFASRSVLALAAAPAGNQGDELPPPLTDVPMHYDRDQAEVTSPEEAGRLLRAQGVAVAWFRVPPARGEGGRRMSECGPRPMSPRVAVGCATVQSPLRRPR